MATYQRAAEAKKLIQRAARQNNQAVNAITNLKTLRDDLLAMSPAVRAEVIAGIGDMGYDATQIQTMLTAWEAMHVEMGTQGLVLVDAP